MWTGARSGDGERPWRGGWGASPYLYALVDGPGSFFAVSSGTHLTGASLTGPQGPVEIRTVASDHPEVGGYLPAGAMLIPVSLLQPATRYTATATFRVAGTAVSPSLELYDSQRGARRRVVAGPLADRSGRRYRSWTATEAWGKVAAAPPRSLRQGEGHLRAAMPSDGSALCQGPQASRRTQVGDADRQAGGEGQAEAAAQARA